MARTAGAEQDVLDVEAVAQYLGVAPVSVYRWCREGRLPCVKLGRVWRVRRAALDDFLRREEQPRSLAGQLNAFLTVPDHVIAIVEHLHLLRRLDTAFFQVAEARGGTLVKFYAGETASADELRDEFARNGLDARELEAAGRLRLTEEREWGRRAAALRQALTAPASAGRTLWASFNWAEGVDLDKALREQQEVAELAGASPLVIKTAVLQQVADEWAPELRRRVEQTHGGTIWLSASRLWLSRGGPSPLA